MLVAIKMRDAWTRGPIVMSTRPGVDRRRCNCVAGATVVVKRFRRRMPGAGRSSPSPDFIRGLRWRRPPLSFLRLLPRGDGSSGLNLSCAYPLRRPLMLLPYLWIDVCINRRAVYTTPRGIYSNAFVKRRWCYSFSTMGTLGENTDLLLVGHHGLFVASTWA